MTLPALPRARLASPADVIPLSTPPLLPAAALDAPNRLAAAGFGLLGCLVFAVASWLTPYDELGRPLSHGTHHQLGLPPCVMNMLTGIPCPSCGMTTSISLVMHGQFAAAWEANWAGVVVAPLGMATTIWLLAVSAGLPWAILSVDDAVKWLVVAGTTTAMVRWLANVPTWLSF
jgi:hypothetical protein